MKETLEKLMKEASERMKDLEKRYNDLSKSMSESQKEYVTAKGKIEAGLSAFYNETFVRESHNLLCFKEQLDRVCKDIAGQQQYVSMLTSQYLELVRLEKGMTAPAPQYSSSMGNNGMFATTANSYQSSASRSGL